MEFCHFRDASPGHSFFLSSFPYFYTLFSSILGVNCCYVSNIQAMYVWSSYIASFLVLVFYSALGMLLLLLMCQIREDVRVFRTYQ